MSASLPCRFSTSPSMPTPGRGLAASNLKLLRLAFGRGRDTFARHHQLVNFLNILLNLLRAEPLAEDPGDLDEAADIPRAVPSVFERELMSHRLPPSARPGARSTRGSVFLRKG